MHPEIALQRWRPLAMALAGAIALLLALSVFAAPDAGAQAVSNGSDGQDSTQPDDEPKSCTARGIAYDPGDEIILITIVERNGRLADIKFHRFICDENGNWREIIERRIDRRPAGLSRATLTVQTATGTKRMTGGLKIPRATRLSPDAGQVMRSGR